MTLKDDIDLRPALNTTLAVPEGESEVYLYAITSRYVALFAKIIDGKEVKLDQVATPSVGGLFTYKVSFRTSVLAARITLHHADGTPLLPSNHILLWNSRSNGTRSLGDLLFEGDIVDALGETFEHPSTECRYALWFGHTQQALATTSMAASSGKALHHIPAQATTQGR